MSEAGLLVHMFDNLEDSSFGAWHVCQSGWCAGTDHLSVSLVNSDLQGLYSYRLGFVLSPSTPFICGYTADGGTQGRPMGGCYQNGRCSSSRWWQCAWQPDQLSEAISTQMRTNANGYNEYIVSTHDWEAGLPDTIEAVICRDDCASARQVHAAYLEAYGRTSQQTPLVTYPNVEDIS